MNPPKLANRLLRSFCSEERLEELEGDLYELFQEVSTNKSPKKAQWVYWWMVLKSFKPYAFKNSKSIMINNIYSFFFMLKHHLIVGYRQMMKHKTTTLINVFGLAIGISAFISIVSIVLHEHSYNQHIPDKENIYRVYTEFSGAFSGTNHGVAAGVPGYLRELALGEIEASSGFHTADFDVKVTLGDTENTFQHVQSIITGPDYFDVFQQYTWLAGNQENALKSPNKVILSNDQAKKFFGNLPLDEILGQTLTYNDSLKVQVSGIVSQIPGNTDFIFGNFLSIATVKNSWLKDRIDLSNWNNTNSSSQLWVRTQQSLKPAQLARIVKPLNAKSTELEEDDYWVRQFKLSPLGEMHFDQRLSIFDNRGRGAANKSTLFLMTLVSVALLSLAIINFINLEIAQVKSKTKEVGVRKVLGGYKGQLIHRFLTASFLITGIAGLLSIPLSYYGGLYFESYLTASIPEILNDMHFAWVILATVVVVSLISGIYPALMVSKYSPREALSSKSYATHSKNESLLLRKSFVSFQFICSQLLIVGSLIIYMQLDYMRNKDVGFETDDIMYITNPWNAPEKNYELLYAKLQEIPELTELINQQNPPASNNYSSTIITYEKGDEVIESDVYKKWGNENYLDFYKIHLLAGEQVEPSEQVKEVVINDTYRRKLGFSSPDQAVGKKLNMSDEIYTISGVMQDFHYSSMAHEIDPILFEYSNTKYGVAGKFSPENLNSMMEKVTRAYQEVYPNRSLEIKFQDQTLREFYETEIQMSRLSIFATSIAILISCMGLFGLISLSVIHRTKEIGIRKVLGASTLNIAQTIAQEFIFLIFIAIVISAPFIYFYGNEWLSNYSYAISLSWWIYALGGVISLVIAVVVTSSKVLHASRKNPVEALRYE